MDIKNEILWRIYTVLAVLVLVAVTIFFKTAQIQIVEGAKWKSKRDSLHVDLRPVKGERGSIMAKDGSLLASSLPFYEIRMDTRASAMTDKIFNDNIDTLAGALVPYMKSLFSSKEDIKNYITAARKSKNRYLFIAKGISYPDLQKIKAFPLFELGPYAGGIIINRLSRRSRPYKMLARRTVGYVTDRGAVGLEAYYNDRLKGDSEEFLMQRIAGGYWVPLNDISEVEPKRGDDIITTIDIDIQDIAGNALLKALKKHDASHGCAIVMEVKTGAIRAIANVQKNTSGNFGEFYNHAIGTKSEPGSTFKLATIMALLEDNYVDLDDVIELNRGDYEFYGEQMRDASFHSLDSATVRKAFEISSNVGLAKMAFDNYEKGEKRTQFIKRLRQFHLHESTNIEIPGEKAPYLKSPDNEKDKWSGTTVPWMAIGYEMEITPLQLLTFYNAVANDGRMMKPYLVSEIRQFGNVVEEFAPTVIDEQIASLKTIKKAKQLLEGVVENGTANNIKPVNYRIAGKTGTAQRNYSKIKKGEKLKYQASFVGYFPSSNPMYSCIVVINDPNKGQFYGSQVAAPVFREISDRCFVKETTSQIPINKRPKVKLSYRQLPSYSIGYKDDYSTVLSFLELDYDKKAGTDWIVMDIDSSAMVLKPIADIPKKVVPNVVGMGLRDAVFKLEEQGISVYVVNGKGKVVKQSIRPGIKARMGMRMYLTLK